MLELVMIVAAVVLMVRIAAIENRSSWLWGSATLLVCFGSLFFPYLPFFRVLIVVVIMVIAMMATKSMGGA